MVKIHLSLLLSLISISLYAQTDTIEEYSITYISEAPCYKVDENGENSPNYNSEKLKEFITNNIKYSEISDTGLIKEVVYISLLIDTVGNTYDHKVIRGVREDINNEALRVTKLIKFEKPAMQRGKPIEIRYTVPMEFKVLIQEEPPKKGCKK